MKKKVKFNIPPQPFVMDISGFIITLEEPDKVVQDKIVCHQDLIACILVACASVHRLMMGWLRSRLDIMLPWKLKILHQPFWLRSDTSYNPNCRTWYDIKSESIIVEGLTGTGSTEHRVTTKYLEGINRMISCSSNGVLGRGINLQGTNLRSANLSDVNLRGANLRGADLQGADFHGADLRKADLSGADFWEADLGGADLQGVDLRGADLQNANLWCANLGGANLQGADLQGADLRGADIDGANIQGTCLDPMAAVNPPARGTFLEERTRSGMVWLHGFRTANSPIMWVSHRYEVGKVYTAPVFSVATTECHPGLYVHPATPIKYYPGPYVEVIFRDFDVHQADKKYRVREFLVSRDIVLSEW